MTLGGMNPAPYALSPVTRDAPLWLPPNLRADVQGDVPAELPVDTAALDRMNIDDALRNRLLPLISVGAVTPIAAPDRHIFERTQKQMSDQFGPICFRPCSAEIAEKTLLRLRGPLLAQRAEERTPPHESCRNWSGRRAAAIALIMAFGLAWLAITQTGFLLVALSLWAVLSLVFVTGIRSLAALVEFRHARKTGQNWRSRRPHDVRRDLLPRMALLVPLYDEPEITARLLQRLERLDYPRDKLDVALILEAEDTRTQSALDSVQLPTWMRVVTVPDGNLRTKPRAMNYALDFVQGEIVGIYDAEDAPAPTQLLDVATGFAGAKPNVGCLQGVLDFYNPRASWLTRCFTIDYAAWFRLILPGMVRLGLAIPLGGTTVFFRRNALESIGRWDAHNVTEDADLGIRLARHGFRTEFVASVTEEEATSDVRSWLKQRSRWIKGYAITWAVHMRDPLSLLGELGFWRFLGFQTLFLGSLSQFILAPLMWSFWLVLFGVPHPVVDAAPWWMIVAGASVFLLCEIAMLTVAALGVAAPKHRWLIKWVPMLHLYHPLAAIASWKGFAELIRQPFFWDKTAHGGKVTRRSAYPSRRRHRHRA